MPLQIGAGGTEQIEDGFWVLRHKPLLYPKFTRCPPELPAVVAHSVQENRAVDAWATILYTPAPAAIPNALILGDLRFGQAIARNSGVTDTTQAHGGTVDLLYRHPPYESPR